MNPLLQRSDMARDSKGITVLPATHSRTISAFTPQPQSITGLWLAFIVPTHRGMARLSLPGWLVIYWDRFSHNGSWTPDTVTHPSSNQAWRRVTSLIKTNTLPLSQTATLTLWTVILLQSINNTPLTSTLACTCNLYFNCNVVYVTFTAASNDFYIFVH